MSKTIANFLVGIGLDTKDWDKGGKNVERGLDSFKTKAGIAGTALAAAFAVTGAAAVAAGKRADEFKLKFSQSDSAYKYAYDLGNAFKRMGADADQAYGAILTAEEKLDRLRSGDKGVFDDLARAGIATGRYSTASTGEEMIKRLVEDLPSMNPYQQRIASSAFGLDGAGMNALKSGEKLQALMIEVGKHSENLDAAAEAGRKFGDEMARAGIIMEGMRQKLSVEILPKFSAMLNGVNDLLEKNSSKVDNAAEFAGKNAGALATITGGLTLSAISATLGAAASKLGMSSLGKVASLGLKAGRATNAVGIGSLLWDVTPDDIEGITGWRPNSYIWDKTPMDAARDVRDWWRGGAVNPYDAAAASPEVAATSRAAIMARQPRYEPLSKPIVLENNLHLDGRVIAKTVNEVNALDNANAISDIQSSVSH